MPLFSQWWISFQGSLITNMIMCVIILNTQYSFTKYASVIMITIGIAICTIISGQEVKSTQPKTSPNFVPTTPMDDFFWWTVGIALLTLALFVSARMGIYQQELHRKYGKRPREALFYTVIVLRLKNICRWLHRLYWFSLNA